MTLMFCNVAGSSVETILMLWLAADALFVSLSLSLFQKGSTEAWRSKKKKSYINLVFLIVGFLDSVKLEFLEELYNFGFK